MRISNRDKKNGRVKTKRAEIAQNQRVKTCKNGQEVVSNTAGRCVSFTITCASSHCIEALQCGISTALSDVLCLPLPPTSTFDKAQSADAM